MASSAYYSWDDLGRPWELARPITELEAWADRNGIAVLGTIGDEAHLTTARPLDHTPFSTSAWPLPLPGFIVCAIDLDPAKGQGPRILALARAGKTPWMKYLITGGRLYHCRDGFQSSVANSDRHDHISVRTDFLNASIGDFDPFGDDDDMGFLSGEHGEALAWAQHAVVYDHDTIQGGPNKGLPNLLKARLVAIGAKQDVILAELDKMEQLPPETATLLRQIDERFETQRTEFRDAVADLGEGGAAQVRAES